MAKYKSNAKERRILASKEFVSKVAKILLCAFCMQFIFYLILVNVIPIGYQDADGNTYMNSFYVENWHNYKGSGVNVHKEGNGIKFIYWYNMILLIANLLLSMYYIVNVFMEENQRHPGQAIKMFFKEHKGLLWLFIFMSWAFLSSVCAYDKFRSFIGCYNLRDGYFSFMFYGSMLVNMLFLGLVGFDSEEKTKKDPRKLIIDILLITATIIAVITTLNYSELNYFKIDSATESKVYKTDYITSFPKVEPVVYRSTVTSSVFNNSNHYGYLLSITVVVAACMCIKAEKYHEKVLYFISFCAMTYVLVINDTFGAFLGVSLALIFMLVQAIISKQNWKEALFVFIAFISVINCIENPDGEKIIAKDFSYIGNSIKAILSSNTNDVISGDDEIKQEIDLERLYFKSGDEIMVGYLSGEILEGNRLSGEIISGEIASGEIVSGEFIPNETKKDNTVNNETGIENAGDAGSGRWKLWVVGMQIAFEGPKDKSDDDPSTGREYGSPLFGVGLENMLYAYNAKGVNEGRSHNLIVQLAGTLGVPAPIFYVVAMMFIFFAGLKTIKTWDMYMYTGMAVMISYLFTALTGNSGFYTSGYFYIFVGLVVLELIKQKKVNKELVNNKTNKK